MTAKSEDTSVSSKNKYIYLLIAIGVVVAGWTGAWFYGRSLVSDQIAQQMARLSASGVRVSCGDLGVFGYPFRYEVRCQDLQTRDRFGAEGKLGSLDAVALIYNPFHIILEADAPAAFGNPVMGLTGELSWETARASVKYTQEALGDVDVVLARPEFVFEGAYTSGVAASEKTELHLRNVPDLPAGIDGYVSIDALRLETLPQLDVPLDTKLHLRLENGSPILSGVSLPQLIQMTGGPLPVQLVFAEIKADASRLGAAGDLVVNENGTLSGKVTLTLSNPDQAIALLKPLMPPQNNGVAVAEGLLTSMKPTAEDSAGNPAIEVPLIIDQWHGAHGLLDARMDPAPVSGRDLISGHWGQSPAIRSIGIT